MKKTLLITTLMAGVVLAHNAYAGKGDDPCSGFHNDYNPETEITTVTGEGVIPAGCLDYNSGRHIVLSEGITGISNEELYEMQFWEYVDTGEDSDYIPVSGTITLTAPTVSATTFSCYDDSRGLYPCSNTNISYIISDNTKIEVDEDEADSWCGESSKEGPVCNAYNTANIYCLGDSQKCAENIADFADFITEKSGLQLVNILETTQTTENGITTVKDSNGNILASYPANDPTPEPTRINLPDGSTKVIDAEGNVHYEGKRIYTIQEANEVSAPTGNRVSLRYK